MPRIDTHEEIQEYKTMIGKKVHKFHSKKPFKSGEKINTVKNATHIHERTGRLCYHFEEDESYVECFRCKEID